MIKASLWLHPLVNPNYPYAIANCSPNFVQVGKGRDCKTLSFTGWDGQKGRAKWETFLMSNHVKSVFRSKPFPMRTKFGDHITFLVGTALLLKHEDRTTPIYCTSLEKLGVS